MRQKAEMRRKAETVGDLIMMGFARRSGETRQRFAHRLSVGVDMIHEIVAGRVVWHDAHGGYISTRSQEEYQLVLNKGNLILTSEERSRVRALIAEIARPVPRLRMH